MVQRWFPWGCLLLRGGIFHRATDNDEFYLSLGFTAYCALGVGLEIQAVDGQDRVYWKNCQPIKVASHPLPIGIRKLSFLILSRPGETLDIDGQEYLTFPNFGATTAGIDKLKFMFNFKVAEDLCEWRRVVAKPLPPACIPVNFSFLGSIFQIDSKDEWVLRGALRDGIFLTVQQLRSICGSLKVALPGRKQGSGKNGNVVKKDIALCLLKHVFPDLSENEGELLKMLKPLMGWNSTPTNVEILSAISELDVDNQDAFKHVQKEALNQFEEAVFGKGKACGIEEATNASKYKEKTDLKVSQLKEKEDKAEVAERKRQFDLTPPSLKLLLPGGGAITSTFWARFHPQKKFFRTDYPTSDMAVEVSARGWKLMSFATCILYITLKALKWEP